MTNVAIHSEYDSQTCMTFKCPFCGFIGSLELMGADRFQVLQKLKAIGAGRRVGKCPVCKSADKERLLYTFLKDVEKLEFKSDIKVLHNAPENNLQLWLESQYQPTILPVMHSFRISILSGMCNF